MTTYHKIPSIPSLIEFPQPITALSFDPVSDILWAGSDAGRVLAYYGNQGMKGVTFHVGGSQAVSKISAGDNYVRALGASGDRLGSWTKGGMNKWFFR